MKTILWDDVPPAVLLALLKRALADRLYPGEARALHAEAFLDMVIARAA